MAEYYLGCIFLPYRLLFINKNKRINRRSRVRIAAFEDTALYTGDSVE